ncbi:hypothetical protein LIPSTDRAFT_1793 [Lipomyces starkeyi NRRL Y-11557]|uniref:Uncharacterized protein n=1 Tax=Lipomyces starkeyi NRRL Y-11557 TaxID=675824 RepID=A0A1E3QBV4_LIPST|nr:hypothetical protein LIPSTDRAFT_1793 [Lipomyces starkeyi NRRL Y-11557]
MNQPGGYNDPLAKQWHEKLVGKKIVETGDANDRQFPKTQLPDASRVIRPGSLVTMDFRPERQVQHAECYDKGMLC